MSLELKILIGVGVWLIILSAFLIWIFQKFRALTKDVKKGNLVRILERVLKSEAKNSKEVKALSRQLGDLTEEVEFHIQKVGLVRFNPFEEMGGDHSFTLAVLDGKDTGFILTGLHTRERTRIYIKSVSKGKSRYELSKEEQKALEKAKKGK